MNSKRCKYISVMILLLSCNMQVSVIAQDAVYSQFMFDALTVNPGLTGINEYNKFTVGFRDQWVQIPNAYVTYFASYDQFLDLHNSGIGVQLYRDVEGGIYSRTSLELFYSYRFQLANNIIVSPGLQVAGVQRAFNASELTLPSPGSPHLENRANFFPDFGVGVVFNFSDRHSLGIAAHHLNGPIETLSEINNKRTPMSLSAHIISYYPFSFGKFDKHQFVLSPGAYFRKQQYQNFLAAGMNVAYDPVFVGLWMRAAGEFSLESAIFMIGLEMYNNRITYNYDHKLATSQNEFPGTGAHEIVVTWKFHPKKQMRAIKCSKFCVDNMNQKSKKKYKKI